MLTNNQQFGMTLMAFIAGIAFGYIFGIYQQDTFSKEIISIQLDQKLTEALTPVHNSLREVKETLDILKGR